MLPSDDYNGAVYRITYGPPQQVSNAALAEGVVARAGKAPAFLAAFLAGALSAFAADLEEKLAPCLVCHGVQGQSEIETRLPAARSRRPTV